MFREQSLFEPPSGQEEAIVSLGGQSRSVEPKNRRRDSGQYLARKKGQQFEQLAS